MKLRPRLSALLALALIGAALSGLLLQQHHGAGDAASALCGDAPGAGCDAVNRSRWSELGGVPVAAVGLVFYASLAALAGFALLAAPGEGAALAGLAAAGLALALLIDLGLLAVQGLAIGAWCALCLASYIVNLAGFALVWPERRALSRAVALPETTSGRLALAGWGIASLAASLGAAAHSLGQAAEGRLRQATLLGQPLAAGDAATGPEHYRAEVARLQAILDDPEKLQQYRSDQAVSAFRAAEAHQLVLGSAPVMGSKDAPIQIVAFSDFLCPYCRQLAGAFAGYIPSTAGRTALFFKHYPLDPACNDSVEGGHPGACEVALGGVCAERQGRFWAYHDRVFSEPPEHPTRQDVVAIAGAAGLERGGFESCLADPGARHQLDADLAEGRRLGVHGTPSVFINGRLLERIGDLSRIVDLEGQRLGLEPAQTAH